LNPERELIVLRPDDHRIGTDEKMHRVWWFARRSLHRVRNVARKSPLLRKCWRRLRRRFHVALSLSPSPKAEFEPIAATTSTNRAVGEPITASPRFDRVGGPRVPSIHSFSVLFVIRAGTYDAASMRYRGFNVMEALRVSGVEVNHLDYRHLTERLAEILSYDLVVLVRPPFTLDMSLLLERAKQHGTPVLCDIDDYLFNEEVIPHVEVFRRAPIEEARSMVSKWREVLERCAASTCSTSYLRERAAELGRPSFLIRNGLNQAQLELSRLVLEDRREAPERIDVRLGYFSGTRTHQDDFRQIATVLVRLLDEFPTLHLVIAGDFDLAEFPDFDPFSGRVEERPFVDWRLLPTEIAGVDVNLIPLEINPFTEGKSNLKYYEAALMKVPSVATPTRAYTECIDHGVNGFLADGPEDWYASLRALILDPTLREQVGERAYRDVLSTYVPDVIAREALTAYGEILLDHRRVLGVPDNAPTIVILVTDIERALRDRSPVLTLCGALVEAGAVVTVVLSRRPAGIEASQILQGIADHGFTTSYALEVGEEIPCCDLLLATDSPSAHRVKRFAHRAGSVGYLVLEYEPAQLPAGDQRERALRSYHLGLALFAFDRTVANLLARHHDVSADVLPLWIETRPLLPLACHDPRSLLITATTSLPDQAWAEAVTALGRVQADHPDLRIILCGEAALRGAAAGLPYAGLPAPVGESFENLLAERPLCVVLAPTSEPRWLYDLMSSGCPVIAVAACADDGLTGPEHHQGFVTATADAAALTQTIDSLLVDPTRLSALTHRAAERVRDMADAAAAAEIVLGAVRRSPLSECSVGTDSPSHRIMLPRVATQVESDGPARRRAQ
jgi:glycosyltransferase involved in cell wall biosynthesis